MIAHHDVGVVQESMNGEAGERGGHLKHFDFKSLLTVCCIYGI